MRYSGLLHPALTGVDARGFPLAADSEAAADSLLTKPLVNILPQFVLESLGVEAAALYSGEPGDVLARLNNLNASPVHFLFDGRSEEHTSELQSH